MPEQEDGEGGRLLEQNLSGARGPPWSGCCPPPHRRPQPPDGAGPTGPELGVVCVYLNSLKKEQQQQQHIILRRNNYMKFKFQRLFPAVLAHRHVCSFTCCLWQLSRYNRKGD